MKGISDLTITRSGDLRIDGPGGRAWAITAIPDTAPTVEVSGEMVREADGRFKQSIKATDDAIQLCRCQHLIPPAACVATG